MKFKIELFWRKQNWYEDINLKNLKNIILKNTTGLPFSINQLSYKSRKET